MNIHEYQARQLLAQSGVAVPPGDVCDSAPSACALAEKLFAAGARSVAVKSQIHSEGRGKGVFKDGFKGGLRLCNTAGEVLTSAKAMLGNVLVTRQTGPEGRLVTKLLVVVAPDIRKELYLAVLLDRAASRPVIMAGAEGGVDVEDAVARTPGMIVKEHVDPAVGLMPSQARKLASALGLNGDLIGEGAKMISGIYKTWWECDATLVEINPLCVVADHNGRLSLLAVDTKVSLDDNALFRHPDFLAMRDPAGETPLETEAGRFNLNFIKLDGNIACLANGAGLAMATMDIIQHYGGMPANFLDVGGGASREQVAAAFGIILRNPDVSAILVNIFGGIVDCDTIANGIVDAVKERGLTLPLVVRFEGNNARAGRKTLAESGLKFITGDSMADAAQKVVKAIAGTQ